MSPAPSRHEDPDLDALWSWGTADPVLGADKEGWLHFNTTSNRLKVWDGVTWKTIVLSQVPTAELADDAVTYAKMQHVSAQRLLGRGGITGGEVEEISAGTGLDFNVAGTALILKANPGGHAIQTTLVSAAVGWREPSNYPCYAMFKDASTDLVFPKLSDATTATFPSAPVAGQIYYHKDHHVLYAWDAAASAWLSVNTYEVPFGNSADLAATAYCEFGELAAFQTFSDTLGWIFGGDVVVVGMSLIMAASGTCTVQAFDDGSAVTNGSLALSSQLAKADETMLSSVIAANSIIGVKVTSGTLEGPARGVIRFKRRST